MRLQRLAVVLLVLGWAAIAADSRELDHAMRSRVTVQVLGLFHPHELVVRAEGNQRLFAITANRKIAVGDSLCPQATLVRSQKFVSFRCGEFRTTAPRITFSSAAGDAAITLSVPDKLRRYYRGKLEVSVKDDDLVAVIDMDLETAVASIVAAELPSDTPIEALKAQAVVTRSFLAASPKRHSEAEFCDTTHCQFLRSPPAPGTAAARASLATRGLLLAWRGKPFPAMYSASCGGATRTLAQAGYRQRDYPYFSVECRYCRRSPVQHGYGPGHGIGLCQHGAAGMAKDGAEFRAILAHYFPNTEIQETDGAQGASKDGF